MAKGSSSGSATLKSAKSVVKSMGSGTKGVTTKKITSAKKATSGKNGSKPSAPKMTSAASAFHKSRGKSGMGKATGGRM